ncbi:MAG: thermonuclease family protein [Hyphomicrobiaceae bacterium]|nr:thermonuclease family protein [Hyphomicrobiaceae bacterium]
MFRWKKRDDGFEWQRYVRTTIKLRREARREKADRIGRSAAEGARAAGIAAGAAARASVRGLGSALRTGLQHFGDVAVAGLGLAGLALGHAAKWALQRFAPVGDVLGRAGVAGPLVLAGSIALLAGLVRTWLADGGLDSETIAALVIGCGCLTLGLAPAVWLGHSSIDRRRLAPSIRLPKLPAGWARWAGAAVAALAGVAGVAYLTQTAIRWPNVSGVTLPAMPFSGTTIVEGRAVVLAADTLQIGGATVRLAGIEAPDPEQRCLRAGNRSWRCGEMAKEAAQRLVRGQVVRCEAGRPDAKAVALGSCRMGESDIAAALVKGGHVFAETGLAPPYRNAEAEARSARAGLWGIGEPERPEVWRAKVWAEAKRKAPEGCPIKGQVANGDRVYLLPWSARYDRVRVSKRRGERWFCSEEEAVAAGFRSASRG